MNSRKRPADRRSVASGRTIALALMMASVLTGCEQENKTNLQVYPVSGRILLDGKPPLRAEVRLRPRVALVDPLKRSIEPYAFVLDDGTFQIGTYSSDDGAPPGEYVLTMVWPVVSVEGGEEVIGPDRLKGRFADPRSPIVKFEVEETENQIPDIDLKSR